MGNKTNTLFVTPLSVKTHPPPPPRFSKISPPVAFMGWFGQNQKMEKIKRVIRKALTLLISDLSTLTNL